ncbi:MAG: hypothetical protein QOJ91_553 [Sphingomonadales bacterium]|jgi:hypothetical protein|nr:hypothetical protein [Sphingomonadales bacterium]
MAATAPVAFQLMSQWQFFKPMCNFCIHKAQNVVYLQPPLLGNRANRLELIVLRKLIGKLLFGRYDAAREESARRVAGRFSRGNTSVQEGRYLDDADLLELNAKANVAFERIDKRVLARAR